MKDWIDTLVRLCLRKQPYHYRIITDDTGMELRQLDRAAIQADLNREETIMAVAMAVVLLPVIWLAMCFVMEVLG